MDKAKFIKRAKECGYTDKMIEEEIKEYEKELEEFKQGKEVFPLDPTDFLFELPTNVPNKCALYGK